MADSITALIRDVGVVNLLRVITDAVAAGVTSQGVEVDWNEHYPQTLRHIAEHALDSMMDYFRTEMPEVIDHLTNDHQKQICQSIADRIAFAYGGLQPYIPTGDEIHRRMRDAAIIADYDGSNIEALALQHRISNSRVRDIIEAHRRRRRDSRQTTLFDP